MESQHVFKIHGYWIMTCACKSYHFTDIIPRSEHVGEIYNEDYFKGGGAGYPDYLLEEQMLIARGRRYAKLLQQHTPPGTVLDIGAAAGFILQGFIECGWTGVGIEPNPQMAQYGINKYQLNIQTTPLEEFEHNEQFDLITMIQVIAHFYNLDEAIKRAIAHLKPGGLLLVETWNKSSLTARILGKNWHEYSPPSVLHFFNLKSLNLLMQTHGLHFVAGGRPSKWISGQHAKSLLEHKLNHSALAKLIVTFLKIVPNRLMIPYPAEDLMWALYRK